jgi:phosphotransferase system HPr (HPr) family protein
MMTETLTCSGNFKAESSAWQSMCSLSVLTETASCFRSDIIIQYGFLAANAKSLLSLMMLDVAGETAMMTIMAIGSDAHAAVAAITQLFTARLGC